jgi:hypothetical protein
MQEEFISDENVSLVISQGHDNLLNSHPECFQINVNFYTGYSAFRCLMFEDILSYEEFENMECNEQNNKKTPNTI